MDTIIQKLVRQQTQATAKQLNQIVTYVASAPFSDNLLQVDAPLWGSFWHGDVISPGYSLPAVELALLRAVRLDKQWPEDTGEEQFLADLRQAILHPQAGVWTLAAAGEPCLVLAAPAKVDSTNLLTVVWYCASTRRLHAGYRVRGAQLRLKGAVKLRGLALEDQRKSRPKNEVRWITAALAQVDPDRPASLAARLDGEILRIRASGG